MLGEMVRWWAMHPERRRWIHSSIDAVHKTCVSPNLIRQDPSACASTDVSIEMARN